MKLNEAYKILDLNEGVTQEEAKKKYRDLTKKYHPDVNKEPNAEDKFKEINKAYECIKNGEGDEKIASYGHNPFSRQQTIYLRNIELKLTIDFKESVLGCKKEMKYSRISKCQDCGGAGEVKLNNGCDACSGNGQVIKRQGGMVMVSSCTKCNGKINIEDCKLCKGEGNLHTDVSINVSVPAGILDGNILKLQGMGNYAGSVMGLMDQYTDALCHVSVNKHNGLHIDGKNVVSKLKISLLDALIGCKNTVETINGNVEINIIPRSRHFEEIIIPKCGVGGIGNQRVILDVEYPESIEKIVEILSSKEM